MRKKTHDEYVSELAIKNPNIEVIGKYIDATTKISFRCKIDNCVWSAYPNNTLRGHGCPKCAGNIQKSHEEYVSELININPYIEVVDKYNGAHKKILHRCLKENCKYEWYVSPHSVLSGNGCPKCANRLLRTHEEYVSELKNINKNIEVIDKYINSHTPILHRCLICDYFWKVQPSYTLLGSGCPKCAGNIQKSHEEYLHDVSLINSNIKVIGKYINAYTPILHQCKIDKFEWFAKPTNILSGKGCPICGGKMKMSHEEYVYNVSLINPNIEVVETYINQKTRILHRCKIDGYEWYALPSNILKGRGCPQCNESRGERQVRIWLNNHDIEFEHQKVFDDCRDSKPLPFDFYLPNYNIAIEYDGKQHYEPIEYFGGQKSFEITVKHDNIKNNYCMNNGIHLLRIPYFKNVEEELNNFLFI